MRSVGRRRAVAALTALLLCSLLPVRTAGKDWSGTGGTGKGPKDEDIVDPATGLPVNFNFTDYTTAVRPDSLEYDRCKVTHRCNRALAHYDVEEATYNFTKQIFPGGVQDRADLFLDFENWKSGTAGLFFDQTYLEKYDNDTLGGHFNSFDFDIIGSLYINHTASLVFNTTDITMQFWAADCRMFEFARDSTPTPIADLEAHGNWTAGFGTNAAGESLCFVWAGELALTERLSTQVAVFNYASLYLGPVVTVTLTGVRALCLVSRSSLVLDTTLTSPPGEIGGFEGGFLVSPYGTNINGPGSGNKRVYLQTITTSATDVDEVQEIITTAEAGQTLGKSFRLEYKGDITHPIAHDATPAQLKQRIESSLKLAGTVEVSRSAPDDQGGFRWNITFVSAPGDVEQLIPHNDLTGRLAAVQVYTRLEGNTIGGFFTVSFEGNETGLIPANARAQELQDILERDLPAVATAHVVRNDPTGLCEHGLCSNGPLPGWGYTYTVTIATDEHNQMPFSPTHIDFISPLPIYPATVTSYLTGKGAQVNITLDHDTNQPTGMPPHPLVELSPFSLAYGGAGGSYGGQGGVGHARHDPAPVYLSDPLPDLIGGSGGNVGGEISQQTLASPAPPGRGGAGGGAVELIAVNDIVIGFNGGIDVSGEAGLGAYRGGGGGSGGAIVLAAGGVVNCHGSLVARGGAGGPGVGTGSRGGGGGGGGRVAAYGQALTWANSYTSLGVDFDMVDVSGGAGGLDALADTGVNGNHVGGTGADAFSGVVRTAENTAGKPGVRHLVSAGGMRYRVDVEKGGAEDTQRTLRMDAAETVRTDSDVSRPLPYVQNGISFSLASGQGFDDPRRGYWSVRRGQIGRSDEDVYQTDEGTRPDRISFYVKLGVFPDGSVLANWGAQFAIHEYDFNHTYFNNSAEAAAGMTGPVDGLGNDGVAMIGVSVVNGDWRHDSNYRHTPGAQLPPPKGVFSRNVQNERWYKVDIFIDWTTHIYKIRLDDITLVANQTFNGESVRRIGLYVFNAATVWWDEIYAGAEDTMGFECPISQENKDPIIHRPWQHGWTPDRLGANTSQWEFVKHESHLSQRSTYTDRDRGGLVFFDGEPHIKFHSDIKFRTPDGDHAATRGGVWSGAMFYVPGDGASDLSIKLAITIAAGGTGIGGGWSAKRDGETRGKPGRFYWFGDHDTIWPDPPPWATGGVACCSTTDMVSWRNEGIMFHYNNMTDDVLGSDDSLHAERPKVMFNPHTQMFVMWMHADNEAIGIRSAGVALSRWANGPYGMLHTIRPDGNETTDLTVFHDESVGKAYLARTYYATVNYFLPEPVMQAMWESVKDVNGTVDFSMNYHRAFYHSAYDNRDDIYQQRWRFEDKEWRIEIGDWVETLDPHAEETERYRLENMVTGEVKLSSAVTRQAVLEEVVGVSATRNIIGQGQPPVETRFKDPTDPINNQWIPGSVPAVKAQNWGSNYLDKNIADNPPHRTVADNLIGVPHIVQSRRAKYIAVSELNDNFTDTTGVMRIVEGELEDDLDLIAILTEYGRFGWDAGNRPRSTYPFDVTGQGEPFYFDTESDWFDREHQFYIVENDRFDDFVNFRDRQSDEDRECPIKHQSCQDRAAQCQIIWSQQELKPEASILDSTFQWHSYSIAQPTVEYEECLRAVRQCLDEYRNCLHTRIPPRI